MKLDGPDNLIEGDGYQIAAIILAICLGIGGCCYLAELGNAKRIQAERRTISITNSFNNLEKKTVISAE